MDHPQGHQGTAAAGKIHSDFERGFIRASVIGYSDLEATTSITPPSRPRVCSAPRARNTLSTMAM